MAAHLETGKKGEEIAVEWLISNQFSILHRNWKFKHYEIDIIAEKDDVLHFIEVKMRSSSRYGYPEESVTKKKMRHLRKAADEFLFLTQKHKWIEFGVLAITGNEKKFEVAFLRDIS